MTRSTATSTAIADAQISADHPFAAHLRRHVDLSTRQPSTAWTPDSGPLPALYLSHGAPPTFEDAAWMAELYDWAAGIPTPRAVLIVSAHWESTSIGITASAPTELVYDFGGFHPMYYRMRYDTPPAHALADLVRAALPQTIDVHEHTERGLDHGAWLPLKVMFPDADIPVLQLSLPTDDPIRLLELGSRLQSLRDEGVLVIGSGFMTHGLPYLNWHRPDEVPAWSVEFDDWAAAALARGDVDELADFRSRAPGLPYAHPTVEHFTPLFVTLGAARVGETVRTSVDGFAMGLSKRSLTVA
ncbi:dioxygenase [Williamsia sp. CHRR-6]|uniref:dioxygenase family protein n=1 Tax=Williamsia sp. CHRR-6 TaxID=2835871 RepID=UPI0035AFE380